MSCERKYQSPRSTKTRYLSREETMARKTIEKQEPDKQNPRSLRVSQHQGAGAMRGAAEWRHRRSPGKRRQLLSERKL